MVQIQKSVRNYLKVIVCTSLHVNYEHFETNAQMGGCFSLDEKLHRTMHSFSPLSLSHLRHGLSRISGNRECWCLGVQAVEGRPLPGPSDADRAGEFSFGRLELGGPISSRFSAIVVSFGRLLQIDSWDYLLARKLRSVKPIFFI